MRLRKPPTKKPAKPRDTGSCKRASLRRAMRVIVKATQPGPNPTPGSNRAYRRTWQPVTGLRGTVLVRVRHQKLEYKQA